MKKLLLATAVAFVFAGSAIAADMPLKAPVKAPVSVFSWTGCYAGVEGGVAWGRMHADAAPPGLVAPLADAHMSGGLVGGTLGCNYQVGTWVLGLENDLSWRRYNVQATNIPPFLGFTQPSSSWLDTLRGRVGYATDRWLLYVTGGVAFTNLNIFESAPGFTPVTSNISHDLTGWTVGAGVEWALPDPRWSVKAEYLYVDYGTHFYNFSGATAGVFANLNVHLTENIARVGLNYRFGGL